MAKESDEYEQFTQQVFDELVDVTVHHQKRYKGRVSQRDIKVDVSHSTTQLQGQISYFSSNANVTTIWFRSTTLKNFIQKSMTSALTRESWSLL